MIYTDYTYVNYMKHLSEKTQIQIEEELKNQVLSSVRVLRDKTFTVGFAESCTGGLLSSFFTEIAGVSDVFVGSIVSYDNKVKQKFLGVLPETLQNSGAVSSETARQMAEGACKGLDVSVAVSVTGIAGPGGGTDAKPVGMVFIAVTGLGNATEVFEHRFRGDRKKIQLQTCIEAMKHLNEFINKR